MLDNSAILKGVIEAAIFAAFLVASCPNLLAMFRKKPERKLQNVQKLAPRAVAPTKRRA